MSEIKPNYALATLWVYIATYKNRASGNLPFRGFLRRRQSCDEMLMYKGILREAPFAGILPTKCSKHSNNKWNYRSHWRIVILTLFECKKQSQVNWKFTRIFAHFCAQNHVRKTFLGNFFSRFYVLICM